MKSRFSSLIVGGSQLPSVLAAALVLNCAAINRVSANPAITGQVAMRESELVLVQNAGAAIAPAPLPGQRPSADSAVILGDSRWNWGNSTYGLVCSVKTMTNVFVIGDPVLAKISIFNASEASFMFVRPSVIHLAFKYFLVCDSVGPVEPWPFTDLALKLNVFSMGGRVILPGSQHSEIVDITDIFPIKDIGDYSLSVIHPTGTKGPHGRFEVMSGVARFRIIANPSTGNRPRERPERYRVVGDLYSGMKTNLSPEMFALAAGTLTRLPTNYPHHPGPWTNKMVPLVDFLHGPGTLENMKLGTAKEQPPPAVIPQEMERPPSKSRLPIFGVIGLLFIIAWVLIRVGRR